MSCFGLSNPPKQVGRKDLSEPYRQGLVVNKPELRFSAKSGFFKWTLNYCIVARQGIYFFPADAEASAAISYIEHGEKNFKVADIPQQGKFLFEVTTEDSHFIFDCANFTEKDEWKKAITKAQSDCKNNAPPEEMTMKAEIIVNLKEAKDLPGICNPYCKVIIGHVVKRSKDKQQTLKPQYNENFDFTVNMLPTELMVVCYDKKGGNDEVIGVTSVKIEVAGERGDQREWFDLRPVKQGEKSKGKIFLNIRTRYDQATLARVIFGVRLDALMKRDSHKDSFVPDIAYKCLKVLNSRALELQGVFRVPGNKNKMRDYELRFDKDGSKVDFVKADDEHMVASIFKMFLRDLPEPVIPYAYFEQTVETTTKPSREEIVAAIRDLLSKLPIENYRLLNITCCLLYKITLHVDKNLMKPTNLAIVFGPVFCAAPPSDEVTKQKMVEKLPALSSAAEYMISDYPAIFGVNTKQGEDPLEDMISMNNSMQGYAELVKNRQYGCLYRDELPKAEEGTSSAAVPANDVLVS